jgi:hypothetical protein
MTWTATAMDLPPAAWSASGPLPPRVCFDALLAKSWALRWGKRPGAPRSELALREAGDSVTQ